MLLRFVSLDAANQHCENFILEHFARSDAAKLLFQQTIIMKIEMPFCLTA